VAGIALVIVLIAVPKIPHALSGANPRWPLLTALCLIGSPIGLCLALFEAYHGPNNLSGCGLPRGRTHTTRVGDMLARWKKRHGRHNWGRVAPQPRDHRRARRSRRRRLRTTRSRVRFPRVSVGLHLSWCAAGWPRQISCGASSGVVSETRKTAPSGGVLRWILCASETARGVDRTGR
jgi:hypothetical protein